MKKAKRSNYNKQKQKRRTVGHRVCSRLSTVCKAKRGHRVAVAVSVHQRQHHEVHFSALEFTVVAPPRPLRFPRPDLLYNSNSHFRPVSVSVFPMLIMISCVCTCCFALKAKRCCSFFSFCFCFCALLKTIQFF